jgi:hypothetical protein
LLISLSPENRPCSVDTELFFSDKKFYSGDCYLNSS